MPLGFRDLHRSQVAPNIDTMLIVLKNQWKMSNWLKIHKKYIDITFLAAAAA